MDGGGAMSEQFTKQVQKAGDNDREMEKFQLIFSHSVKTITPLATFLIKNLAWESIFFSMWLGKLTCLQIKVPCGRSC